MEDLRRHSRLILADADAIMHWTYAYTDRHVLQSTTYAKVLGLHCPELTLSPATISAGREAKL